MQEISTIFTVIVLIFSVVLHEVSHGYVAYRFGDTTALYAGRLTLNPFKHLDLYGSFLVPLLLILSGAPAIGWAKPVPYNERNFSNIKLGTIAVASAGIITNLIIAALFGILIRSSIVFSFATTPLITISSIIVLVNVSLAVFNAIPVPPLDGSKILFSLLPSRFLYIERFFERHAMIFMILLIIILFQSDFLFPIVRTLFTFFSGLQF